DPLTTRSRGWTSGTFFMEGYVNRRIRGTSSHTVRSKRLTMLFDLHIGIDYSGAEKAQSRLAGLQVYLAAGSEPIPVQNSNWTRIDIADWLIRQVQAGKRFIVGIDHAFSFPNDYIERHGLKSWDDFLDDFVSHWPTDQPGISVEAYRKKNQYRMGRPTDF